MRSVEGGNAGRFVRELPSPVPIHSLDARITPERAYKYRQVLARRTTRLVVVIEDCYDPHNATAILRTCDTMGIHRCVVTTANNGFRVNPQVSQGVHRYLDLHVLPDIDAAANLLKPLGYRFWVTDLTTDAAVGPAQLLPRIAESPIAVIFGNEGHGISARARELADGAFLLPMSGFSQSLNLSVSVAMTLQALRGAAVADDVPGDLSAETQCATYDSWVRAYCGEAPTGPPSQPAVGKHGEAVEEFRG
ncbi:MAG: RNA methyltransferase [Planctomycetota bacterium]